MKQLVNILTAILGFGLLVGLFYLRLFNNKTIQFLFISTDVMHKWLYFYILSLSVISLIILSYYNYLLWLDKTPGKLKNKWLKWVSKLILESLVSFYTILYDAFLSNHIEKLLIIIRWFNNISKYYLKLIILVNVVPRVIILITFIIEVFFYSYLHIYFYTLLLLLLPLLCQFFMFFLEDCSWRVKATLKDHLNFGPEIPVTTPISDISIDNLYNCVITFKPEYQEHDLDFFMFQYYYPILTLSQNLHEFKLIQHETKLCILLLYTLGMVFGWTSILYLNYVYIF